MVIVNRLAKYPHSIPLSHPYKITGVAQTFFNYVYILHYLPSSIIIDRDPFFTNKFWRVLIKLLGVELNTSLSYHPQIDG
jgi:hypothetical protein